MIFLIGDLRYFCKKIMIRDKTFDFFAIKIRRTDDKTKRIQTQIYRKITLFSL